jgi:hypothetical protein
MKERKINSLGQIPTKILIAGIAIIILIVLVFVILKVVKKPPPPPPVEKKQEPVYETIVGNVKFKLVEAKDRGNRLLASESKNPEYIKEDLVTTDRFIEVTISAENIGKDNIPQNLWDMEELVDKEGRKFYSSPQFDQWVVRESKCGALLKPGFTPTPCTKIYEVANVATGLKVKVSVKTVGTQKGGEGLIDIGL